MYLYDAQTGKIHRVTTALRDTELKALGYKGSELEFVTKLCYAMEGLDQYPDEEANKATELRLFYAKKLLIAKGVVLGLRTQVFPVLPGIPTLPRLVFAKFRQSVRGADRLHDYRYVLSNTPFDEPVFGSLDHL